MVDWGRDGIDIRINWGRDDGGEMTMWRDDRLPLRVMAFFPDCFVKTTESTAVVVRSQQKL